MTLAASLLVIGRIIFGLFFLIAGIRNFSHFSGRKNSKTNYGWSLPTILAALGFAVQIVGGLSLIFGLWTVFGALALIIFLVLATSLFHNLFLFEGDERNPHLYFTLVNITLVGGLLMVIAEAL
ncbi:DoxX family protein [Devosia rhodophyticola]|uniref:DoxX family protein n=1 Tax=Devosia rhodophyticola TaxID=3026423 RepID=A0ABY7Z0R9_9HYPH|nr:DoxX family protein [Devosia rhodophyticola]WDR07184.1 DoxX family protein [Devosia rhodophyticola]